MSARPLWITRIGLLAGILTCLIGTVVLIAQGPDSGIGLEIVGAAWFLLIGFLVYFYWTRNVLSLALGLPSRKKHDEFEQQLAYKALARSFSVIVLLIGFLVGLHANGLLIGDRTHIESVENEARRLMLSLCFVGYTTMALPSLLVAWSVKPLDIDDEVELT